MVLDASHEIDSNINTAGVKTLTVLGATGSIGTSTLDLIDRNRNNFAIVALTANNNVAELAQLARKFDAKMAVIGDETLFDALKEALAGTPIAVGAGEQGLLEAASMPADITMAGIMGAAGLRPTLAAVKQGKQGGTGQQGMSCSSRNLVHARSQQARNGTIAGRFRTFCDISGS